MSRKHNTKHERGPSRYKARLEARGLSQTRRMPSLDELRKWQGAASVQFLPEGSSL